MSRLHQGDEHIAHDLLSHVIFNQAYTGYEFKHSHVFIKEVKINVSNLEWSGRNGFFIKTYFHLFFSDLLTENLEELSDLRLEERDALLSATQENFGMPSRTMLSKDIIQHLASMRASYMAAATPFMNHLPKSR